MARRPGSGSGAVDDLHKVAVTQEPRTSHDDPVALQRELRLHGGQQALQHLQVQLRLAAERGRLDDLRSLLAEWDADAGPVSDEDVAAMTDRYGL
jgi:hypothetical protein